MCVSLMSVPHTTFHRNVDTRGKKQSPKAIVEDLIAL